MSTPSSNSRTGKLTFPHPVPVTVVVEVDSVDEAVELADATQYSLVGSVWTRDLNTALDVSSRIRAGKQQPGLSRETGMMISLNVKDVSTSTALQYT